MKYNQHEVSYVSKTEKEPPCDSFSVFWCGQEDMKSLRYASGARCTNRVENERITCILQRFCITPYSYQKTKKEPLYDSFSVFGAGKRT